MTRKDLTGPSEINALLGKGTEYVGKLTFDGRVRIEGKFEGEVFSEGTLIIADGAQMRADVDVGTLIVLGGEVWGDIRARQLVELHAPGKVHGNIRTPQIFMDRGVVFDGQCTMDGQNASEQHSLEASGEFSGELGGDLASSVEAALDMSGSMEILPDPSYGDHAAEPASPSSAEHSDSHHGSTSSDKDEDGGKDAVTTLVDRE